ncbi:hypothetical protein G6N82_10325 [Altererythrobacter sp. BO-6]|uniref:hypothetical protein n=1 Tax=Altererythrobacter sp. BO-6 TaxID=2604537 RepID=UPI0013E1D18F|nr:hypothetical protein [Altererythrobacter sp. BO-6]QIG54493.1 hypothetical protein G6N82_10325 [Altererythrobacter sp. BO-6]
MPAKHAIPDDVWNHYADRYELGLMHACEIADRLGVSQQVVAREFRKMGAKKGSRVHQTVADLEAFFERRERREYMRGLSEVERRRERQALVDEAIERMMTSIMAADRLGDLTLADERIARTADAFGVKITRGKKARSKS